MQGVEEQGRGKKRAVKMAWHTASKASVGWLLTLPFLASAECLAGLSGEKKLKAQCPLVYLL